MRAGWRDDEVMQSKFPVLERADVLGCWDGDELVSQIAVYPLRMNIHSSIYDIGHVTSVSTYPEYSGRGIMKHLLHLSLTRIRENGRSLALLFPYWMEYAMKANGPELFVKFAPRVFGCQNDFEHPEVTAMEGIHRVREFMNELNMPSTISELGGKEEDIPVMVENMFHGAPNHGNFVKLTPEIAAEIYRMAL